MIRNVCILGGTHGNELSGVSLVRKWKKNSKQVERPSFCTKLCFSNPEAIAQNRRYVDCDLNRQFSAELLEKGTGDFDASTPYEVRRAKELQQMLTTGGALGPCDVILDLHNTTANVKTCLIFGNTKDTLTLQMMKYVHENLPPQICYLLSVDGPNKYPDSRRLAPHGIGIEIGPQPQGVLRADVFLMQEKVVMLCLDFLHKLNLGETFPKTEIAYYQVLHRVPYPRDEEGNRIAMIHSKLQDEDWDPIGLDDPVFLKTDGGEMYLRDVVSADQIPTTVYPMFINEAAYYEKDCAFLLTEKKSLEVAKLEGKRV